MTIHQALVELKTLDKRIGATIRETEYVVANKHSNRKINGVDVSEFCDNVKSHYQKVIDLMSRRNALKRAVANSNAVTKVEINGTVYTVAEAIEMKNHGLEYSRSLLEKLREDYSLAYRAANRYNGEDLERRADEHIKVMFGSTDVKGVTDEVKRARADFITAQTVELVDPIDVRAKIEAIAKDIDSFESTVDAALSVSNALTTITIEY
jgi:hypothetical protein